MPRGRTALTWAPTTTSLYRRRAPEMEEYIAEFMLTNTAADTVTNAAKTVPEREPRTTTTSGTVSISPTKTSAENHLVQKTNVSETDRKKPKLILHKGLVQRLQAKYHSSRVKKLVREASKPQITAINKSWKHVKPDGPVMIKAHRLSVSERKLSQ